MRMSPWFLDESELYKSGIDQAHHLSLVARVLRHVNLQDIHDGDAGM